MLTVTETPSKTQAQSLDRAKNGTSLANYPVTDFHKELEIREITQVLRASDSAFVSCLLNQIRIWEQRKQRQQRERLTLVTQKGGES